MGLLMDPTLGIPFFCHVEFEMSGARCLSGLRSALFQRLHRDIRNLSKQARQNSSPEIENLLIDSRVCQNNVAEVCFDSKTIQVKATFVSCFS
ncbi:hypothetical protein Baya_11648 [Bagarius yarrelli]|uniref:Uncharacterized protein n=1 Tax=Bagarius yarrelli TaxID=175774 RepID=A0A556V0Z9_BAGYA|nr:hypothetical protein Baya_11648 [Bagarius yarrelli]